MIRIVRTKTLESKDWTIASLCRENNMLWDKVNDLIERVEKEQRERSG